MWRTPEQWATLIYDWVRPRTCRPVQAHSRPPADRPLPHRPPLSPCPPSTAQVFEEGKASSVLTVHEMLHDSEYTAAPFYKLDPDTFDAAIACLERAGKAHRFGNPGEEGEGIKFS